MVSVFVVAAAVASLVSLIRHPPPKLDRSTRRRVTRELNRGRLPAEEPDRSSAVRLAGSRAASYWGVVMLMSLATSQVLLARSMDGFDPRYLYAVAALLGVTAGLGLHEVITSRLALRRSGLAAS